MKGLLPLKGTYWTLVNSKVDPVRKSIDLLTAEFGTKKNGFWIAELTVKQVLEKADIKNTSVNQNYVLYTVKRWYLDSTFSVGQGDNGGYLHMRIRGI